MVAALAVRSEAGTLVEVDGAVGVRSETLAPPDPGRDVDYGSRHVHYSLAVPGEPWRWLVIAFSTIGAGDPDDDIARLLADLFDAVMMTFRWRRAPEDRRSQGERTASAKHQ